MFILSCGLLLDMEIGGRESDSATLCARISCKAHQSASFLGQGRGLVGSMSPMYSKGRPLPSTSDMVVFKILIEHGK